jgi:HupE / UreJ protein
VRIRIVAVALCVAALAGAAAATASAHPMSTSAIVLDVDSDKVGGEIQLPVDRLAVALHRELTPEAAAGSLRTQLETYTRSHISAVGADGHAWGVTVAGGHIERIDGVDHLVMSVTLTPPDVDVTDFDLRYDAIVEELVTHKAIATIRSQWGGDPETLGVFDWNTESITVDADGGSWLRGLAATAGLGVQHIGEGADHLLFLLMLLIPAPLAARDGRWARGDDPRRSVVRVVHVVTAFAAGHSTTLALASLGIVDVPTRLVESLIALSILVSAVHAIRPLVPGGEAPIAAGFGLVHGLAFATLLGDLGLAGGSLASSLLGFNLGIEATQLLVVALMMPSLYVLSRTAAYGAVRVGVALLGLTLSAGWLLERTTLIGADPFEPISTVLVEQPLTVAAGFALLAAASHVGSHVRGAPDADRRDLAEALPAHVADRDGVERVALAERERRAVYLHEERPALDEHEHGRLRDRHRRESALAGP